MSYKSAQRTGEATHCKKHNQNNQNCRICLEERVGDTMNQFFVGVRGDEVVIMNPPRRALTRKEALVFAAWLVFCASGGDEEAEFVDVLRLVQS